MKVFGVDANIVALSGIAIAIGTMVDMGIIITENIFRHLDKADPREDRLEIVLKATQEVGGAVLTAVSTTIVSFLPVFTLVAAEGKLFRPLAFTKTFALLASLFVALCLIPPLAYTFFSVRGRRKYGWIFHEGLIYLGGVLAFTVDWRAGLLLVLIGGYNLAARWLPERFNRWRQHVNSGLVAIGVTVLLVGFWKPLGPKRARSVISCSWRSPIGGILGAFRVFQYYYDRILLWCLDHKIGFSVPAPGASHLGGLGLAGVRPAARLDAANGHRIVPTRYLAGKFPGLGREFMPPLDEGAYLYMPVTMPHASIGEVLDILQRQDRAIGGDSGGGIGGR